MEVPRSCVGFIMGKFGMSLREVEFEFNTLMVRQRLSVFLTSFRPFGLFDGPLRPSGRALL